MAKAKVSTDITTAAKSVWVRWLPNALPAAGFVTFKNSSGTPLEVIKVSSPDYKGLTIYQTVTDSDSSRTVEVDKFTIPAKGELALAPGSYHLVLQKPTHLITPGDNARVVFWLSDGTVFKLRMPVRTSPELH